MYLNTFSFIVLHNDEKLNFQIIVKSPATIRKVFAKGRHTIWDRWIMQYYVHYFIV